MRLWLLRHAHAARDSDTGRDFDRPLDARGRAEARALNARLRAEGIPEIGHIRVSPALRAGQTAKLTLAQLGLPEPVSDPRIWEATGGELVEVAREGLNRAGEVMLIGHNPGLEGLARWLCGEARPLRPGSLVVLELQNDLLPGWARVVFEFHPD